MAKQKYPVIFIIILCAALYANTLFNGYALDDRAVITQNSLTQKGLTGIGDLVTHDHFYGYNHAVTGLYRPIPLASHAIEFEVAGLSPFLGHLVNMLLYIMACVALFYALSHWFTNRNPLLPLVAVILFTVHPLHTEVVANIKGRDELFTLIFLSFSVIFSFRYIQRSSWLNLALSLLFFALALFSKESAMTFLAVIPLSLWFFSQASMKKILYVFAGMAVVAVFYLLTRSQFVDSASEYRFIDGYHQYCTSRADRLATSTAALLDYLKLLVFPYPLVYDYSYNHIPVVTWASLKTILSLAIHLFLIIFALSTFRRKHILSFCILTYFITLSVFANIITPTSAVFAERFLFIPSIAFSIAVSWLLLKLFKIPDIPSFSSKKMPSASRYLFPAAVAIIILGAAIMTIIRNRAWKDDFTLFTTDLVNLQDNARAHYNVGTFYAQRALGDAPAADTGASSQAIRYFSQTVAIDPGFTEAWAVAGVLLYNRHQFPEAIAAFGKAEETAGKTTLPQYSRESSRRYAAKAWFSMGIQAFKKASYPVSANCFRNSISLNPSNPDAWLNIASCHYNQRQYDSAVIYYQKTLQLNPGEWNAWHNLGMIAFSRKQTADAAGFFRKAAENNPALAEKYRKMGINLK